MTHVDGSIWISLRDSTGCGDYYITINARYPSGRASADGLGADQAVPWSVADRVQQSTGEPM